LENLFWNVFELRVPLLVKIFQIFGKPEMEREVRLAGSNCTSGKDSTSS
jgi:hypothetical protein